MLYLACAKNHLECVRLLCDRGADLNLQDEGGGTALMLACQDGYLATATLLCERGASLNLLKVGGAAAVHLACQNNHLECARLLERGANTLLSLDGTTPYSIASSNFGADSPLALFLEKYPH